MASAAERANCFKTSLKSRRRRALWISSWSICDPIYTLPVRGFMHCLVGFLLLLMVSGSGKLFGADSGWIRAKLGPFEAVSDSRPAALQALSQFEQFGYARVSARAQPDLRLTPPLRILVFRDPKDMAAQGCDGIHIGRDHLMACAVA